MRTAIALHLLVVAWLTVLPLPVGDAAIERARALATYDHNAVPLATLGLQLDGGLSRFELRQWIGNLLLLLPIGIYGPMRWRALRHPAVAAAAGVAASAAIELGQLVLAGAYGFPVRIADVDDVVLNATGVLVGWTAWRSWDAGRDALRRGVPTAPRAAPRT